MTNKGASPEKRPERKSRLLSHMETVWLRPGKQYKSMKRHKILFGKHRAARNKNIETKPEY